MNNPEGGRINPNQPLRTASKALGAVTALGLVAGCMPVPSAEAASHQSFGQDRKSPGHELIVPMPQYDGSFIFANSGERNAEQLNSIITYNVERAESLEDGTTGALLYYPKDPNDPNSATDTHYVEGKGARLQSKYIVEMKNPISPLVHPTNPSIRAVMGTVSRRDGTGSLEYTVNGKDWFNLSLGSQVQTPRVGRAIENYGFISYAGNNDGSLGVNFIGVDFNRITEQDKGLFNLSVQGAIPGEYVDSLTPLIKTREKTYVNYGLSGGNGINEFTYNLDTKVVNVRKLMEEKGNIRGELVQFMLDGVPQIWAINNSNQYQGRSVGRMIHVANGQIQPKEIMPKLNDYDPNVRLAYTAGAVNTTAGEGYMVVSEDSPKQDGGVMFRVSVEKTTNLKDPSDLTSRTKLTRAGLPQEGTNNGYNGLVAYTKDTPEGKRSIVGLFVTNTPDGKENGYYEIDTQNGSRWERVGQVILQTTIVNGTRLFIPVVARQYTPQSSR